MDLNLAPCIKARLYPDTVIALSHPSGPVSEAGSYGPVIDLHRGSIGIAATRKSDADGCKVVVTNGVVCVRFGIASIQDNGRVSVHAGSAAITMKTRREPVEVPEGYIFEPGSGEIVPKGWCLATGEPIKEQ